jgi:hypothetical protein
LADADKTNKGHPRARSNHASGEYGSQDRLGKMKRADVFYGFS